VQPQHQQDREYDPTVNNLDNNRNSTTFSHDQTMTQAGSQQSTAQLGSVGLNSALNNNIKIQENYKSLALEISAEQEPDVEKNNETLE